MTVSLEQLKEQADDLGIKYSPNISATTLQQRIADQLNADEGLSVATEQVVPMLSKADKIKQIRAEALALKRVIITSMDTSKRDYHGEVFQVANRIMNVKRFVPFGYPTHVEAVLLNQIQERQMRMTIPETRDKAPESRLVPAFGIKELPPLTAKELADLAKAQQARNSID